MGFLVIDSNVAGILFSRKERPRGLERRVNGQRSPAPSA